MEYLAQHIESLIFTCEQPISFKEIKSALEEIFETQLIEEELKSVIQDLMDRYKSEDHAFEVVKIAGGYQFLTKGAFHNTVGTYLKQTIKKRLSRAALETLAIIAYKQPVTKTDIENIRGVNCDYAVQKLLEKELVSITGRKEAPGRPLLYGTSQKFMDYFGIENIIELPKLKEFTGPENSIGEAAPIEEMTSANGTPVRREDDVIDVAIAVANIYLPQPPIEEIEAALQEASEEDANTEILAEEMAATETALEENVAAEALGQEEASTEIAAEEETLEEQVAAEEGTPEEAADEPAVAEALIEETNEEEIVGGTPQSDEKEVIAEFVQETTGEFAGQTDEEILQENPLPSETENLPGADDVTPEEVSPVKD